MEKEIIVSKRFGKNAKAVYEYLLLEFSPKIAYQFLVKLQHRVEFISHYPDVGKVSQKKPNVRSLLLHPHNRIFYRITSNRIELLCLFDMRKKRSPY